MADASSSSASTSAAPPLGQIRGMTWNPERRKYFPTPKIALAVPAIRADAEGSRRSVRFTDRVDMGAEPIINGKASSEGKGKRQRAESSEGSTSAQPSKSTYRRRALRRPDSGSDVMEDHYARLMMRDQVKCGTCRDERVTSFQTFMCDTFFATTDHGRVTLRNNDGDIHRITICSQPIVGLHCDIPRLVMMAVSAGDDPHIHFFRRDPAQLDTLGPSHTSCDLETTDVHCLTSFDDTCTIASSKTMTTVKYDPTPRLTSRKLPSDPLALHQKEPNLIFAGLRNSNVVLADLRTPWAIPNNICKMTKGKAVVGVQRLDDAAVPFGLVASGMGSELLIFDIRFGKIPLHSLPDHINTYYTDLALATSPNDKFIWAAGSDNRLGVWNSITGERVHPIIDNCDHTPARSYIPKPLDSERFSISSDTSTDLSDWSNTACYRYGQSDRGWAWDGGEKSNPLTRIYGHRIRAISVKDDGGLDLAVGGVVLRFGPGTSRAYDGRDEEEEDDEDHYWQ